MIPGGGVENIKRCVDWWRDFLIIYVSNSLPRLFRAALHSKRRYLFELIEIRPQQLCVYNCFQ